MGIYRPPKIRAGHAELQHLSMVEDELKKQAMVITCNLNLDKVRPGKEKFCSILKKCTTYNV